MCVAFAQCFVARSYAHLCSHQLEAVFQLPVFFVGLYALYRDDRRFWVLLLIYGASTTVSDDYSYKQSQSNMD